MTKVTISYCHAISDLLVDMFADPAYDYTRKKAQKLTEYMRRHGLFEPHRLPMEDYGIYSTSKILAMLEIDFETTL